MFGHKNRNIFFIWFTVKNTSYSANAEKERHHLRLTAWCFTNAHCLICKPHMKSILIYCRVHSNTGNPHLMCSSNHTDCNFPSICHKNLLIIASCIQCSSIFFGFPDRTSSSFPWKAYLAKLWIISHHKAALRAPNSSGRSDEQPLFAQTS